MKKYLILLLLAVSINAYSQLDSVYTGTGVAGTGEKMKTAFLKVNDAIRLLNRLQLYNDSTNAQERKILDGALITTAELNYGVGVISPIQTQLNGKEPVLGNPVTTGYVLSSTTAGVRSWVANGTGTGGVSESTVRTIVADSINALRANALDASTIYKKLIDTIPVYTFVAGDYSITDSVLFAKGAKSFGGFTWPNHDTLHITSMTINRVTPGDSCVGNIYIGNLGTLTATDSLFLSPYRFGTYYMGTFIAPTKSNDLTYGKGIWLGLKADQITGKRPWGINIQLNTVMIRK